jgi:hypothetical protein
MSDVELSTLRELSARVSHTRHTVSTDGSTATVVSECRSGAFVRSRKTVAAQACNGIVRTNNDVTDVTDASEATVVAVGNIVNGGTDGNIATFTPVIPIGRGTSTTLSAATHQRATNSTEVSESNESTDNTEVTYGRN